MPEWLSDEELDAIARTFADECDVEKLLAQASEANRLRAGLEELAQNLLNDDDAVGFSEPKNPAEWNEWLRKVAGLRVKFDIGNQIRELLEGGE